jgi:hypothetical protein
VEVGLAMFVLAARLLRSDTEPGELQMVPHNITTEMELQLWALTQRIRADAAGSEALRGSPAAELARRFGAGALPPASCRAASPVPVPLRAIARSAEIDVGIPRWSEDPTHIIGVLTTLFDKPNPLFAGPVFAHVSGQTTRRSP